MAPAAGRVLDHDAPLRAQRSYSAPELGVAVGVDRGAGVAPAPHTRRPAERRYRWIDVRHIRGIELDQSQIVERAGVSVRLALRLHGEPRVVDKRPRMARAGDVDRRSRREGARGAAVGVSAGSGARAVRGLAEVHVRRVLEDEVRRALCTGREYLDAGMDGRRA